MSTVFVAWKSPINRSWTPVGRLDKKGDVFEFVYTRGAEHAAGFLPFGRMEDLHKVYRSEELFAPFANRVVPKNRPEYREYLGWLGLSDLTHDVLEELGRTGGIRATDSVEVFPCPEPTSQRTYRVHFFARGLSHLHAENSIRSEKLRPGERLYLMSDFQNAHDQMALLLRTGDPITLVGYAPRYFSGEFSRLIKSVGSDKLEVTVQRVNLPAPLQYRVLCTLSAPWPADFVACSGEDFVALAH